MNQVNLPLTNNCVPPPPLVLTETSHFDIEIILKQFSLKIAISAFHEKIGSVWSRCSLYS